jgi:hypothetical protein
MPTLRSRLERAFRRIEGLDESASMYSDEAAWWANGKEIAHFRDDRTLDIRLTRALIAPRRAAFREDPRVTLRPSSAADWLMVGVSSVRDLPFAESLVREAVRAHLPPGGSVPRPPPTGADLERRRRFH